MVIVKKNHANAFVDIRKSVGPRPIFCAISVGLSFEQHGAHGVKYPSSSQRPKFSNGLGGWDPAILFASIALSIFG